MKIKIISALALSLVFMAPLTAQNNPDIRRFHVHDLYLLSGVNNALTNNATLNEFRELAPESALLSNDFNGFRRQGWGWENMSYFDNQIENIMLGIEFGNKDRTAYRPNPQLRLGFSYYNSTLLQESLVREDRYTYDTLVSQRNGEIAVVDSISRQQYDIRYYSEQIRLDVSLLFSTNPEARWTLFAGVGITAGFSLNSGLEMRYGRSSWQETTFPNDRVYYNSGTWEYEEETEDIKLDGNFGMSIHFPMGVGFRIGKEREFWKRLQLFYEARPGLNINTIPGYGTVNTIGGQHGMGLRVRW